MKRLLWLGVGVAIGALVVRAVSRKAQAYTPSGLASAARDSGRNLLDSMRDFVDDVRDGMRERERELHAALLEGTDPDEVYQDQQDHQDRDGYGDRDGEWEDGAPVGGPAEGTAR